VGDEKRRRSMTSSVPNSELIDIGKKLAALSTEQHTTRKQVLEPLALDVREARDQSRSTAQALDTHLKDCEDLDSRVGAVETNGHGGCVQDGQLSTIKAQVKGNGGKLKWAAAAVGILFLPVMGMLAHSVRAEETMRSGITNNAKATKLVGDRFGVHVAKQQRDMEEIINAIDGVPAKVASKVNGHSDLTDEDIERIVAKLPSLQERRRARALLRKAQAVSE